MFHSWLQIHKDTLRHIRIGKLSYGAKGRLFNAAEFPNLEYLRLSRWLMNPALDTAEEDAELLLAPKLRKFVWDFATNEVFRENWKDFGEREEEWLRGFAKAAIARRHGLQVIDVRFSPEDMSSNEPLGYPYDRMDRVREEIRSSGLELVHDTPSYSREEWMDVLNLLPWVGGGG